MEVQELTLKEESVGSIPFVDTGSVKFDEALEKNIEKRSSNISHNSFSNTNKIIRDGFGLIRNPLSIYDNELIYRYTLLNEKNVSVQVITYGATITSIKMPDKKGNFDDIVLGFENSDSYRSPKNPYFGATIGRTTGIIPNQEITVEHEKYFLTNNFMEQHHANGGFFGFDKVLWNHHVSKDTLYLSYSSKCKEEGYPGDVLVNRSFKLTPNNELIIETSATVTKPTPIDISTHIDWNLSSHAAGPNELYKHYLMVNADKYAQLDKNHIMTGKLKKVNETVLDLRIPRPLGKLIHKVPGGGYDHYLNLTRANDRHDVTFAAKLMHPESGRYIELLTDQPGLLIYTENNLYAHPSLVKGHPISCWCNDLNTIAVINGTNLEDGEPSAEKNQPEQPDPDTVHEIPSGEVAELANSKVLSSGEVAEVSHSKEIPSGDVAKLANSKEIPSGDVAKLANSEELVATAIALSSEKQPASGDASGEIGEVLLPESNNSLEKFGPVLGKYDSAYVRHGGIRLVPVNYPEPVARKKRYKGYIVNPGEKYVNTTIFHFGTVFEKTKDLTEVVIE